MDNSRFYDPNTRRYSETSPTVMNSEQIRDTIDQILGRRRKNLEALNNVDGICLKLQQAFKSFHEQCDAFRTQTERRQKVFGQKSQELMEILQQLDRNEAFAVENTLADLKKRVKVVRDRFRQDSICICVLGKSGNGKSRLLQSITGLDDYTIPTSNISSCTGTRMVIRNADQYKATIHFYTKDEFFHEVIQPYADHFGANIQVVNMDDIQTIINSDSKEFDQYFKRLQEYQKHRSEYEDDLGEQPKILYDKEQVRKYVSQVGMDTKNDTKNDTMPEAYYHFMAVKYVEVECPFPTTEVKKLILVDSVGINENTLNVENDMLNIISTQADFVIYLKKMGNPHSDQVDTTDWGTYFNICHRRDSVSPYGWLYWVFNRDEGSYIRNTFENSYFESVVTTLINQKGKDQDPAGILNVDCSKVDEVRSRLISPLLTHIATHAIDNDEVLVSDVNHIITRLNEAYAAYHKAVQNLILPDFDYNTLKIQLAHRAFEDMVQKLNAKRAAYCRELLQLPEAQNWRRDMMLVTAGIESIIPDQETIQAVFNRSGSALLTIERAFEMSRNALNHLFNDAKFDYSLLSARIRKDAAKMILESSGLDQAVPDLSEQPRPLKAISDKFFTIAGTSSLQRECMTMDQFQVTGRSDMAQMTADAMRCFDPNSGTGNFPNRWEPGSMHEAIINSLAACIPEARESMQKKIGTMISPYQQACTAIETFVSDIASQSMLLEWQTVFFTNADVLWKDLLAEYVSIQKDTEEWNRQVKTLAGIERVPNVRLS